MSRTLTFGQAGLRDALSIVLLSVGTTVPLAQLASLFQMPQPPIVWRVKPVSG